MVGKKLSHYKILDELGRGGMGIVYQGEDTKLHRTVAIKVLPAAALSSDDDRARFYREARAAASLSHPNIAVIHEIDEAVPEGSKDDDLRPFIAMEFIEGDTLEDRVKQGPMKLEEAVRIASEVASALEAAHEKDIVHRDIKAANVMLTAKGSAKVLDFGLAQTAASTKLTRMGSTLGTVAYMSPEQARGEEVDSRTDIWALGITLYEMIAGRHPFPGDYEQAAVYSILNEDPEPLTAVRTGVPMSVEWIVSKCLAKKAQDRYQTATDLLVDLRNVDLLKAEMSRMSDTMTGFGQTQASAANHNEIQSLRKMTLKVWPVIAFTFAVALGLGYLAFSGGNPQPWMTAEQKYEIYLDGIYDASHPTASPTSEYLAFSGMDTLGRSGIFLFHVKSAEITYVDGTEGGFWPRFSPDASQLAFGRAGAAFVITMPTGVPEKVVSTGIFPVWESAKSLLYFDQSSLGTRRIDLESGDVTPVAMPDTSSADPYRYYVLSVDLETGMGVGVREIAASTDPTLLIIDLESGVMSFEETGGTNPNYASSGFIVYQLGRNTGPYVARAFDPQSREFMAPPAPLINDIIWTGQSVGADGSYLYVPELLGTNIRESKLFLYTLSDRSVEAIDGTAEGGLARPAFSPDGTSVAVEVQSYDNSRPLFVSVYDLQTGVFRRRTFGAGREDPDWSPDGSFLYYDGSSSKRPGIYRQAADVPGEDIPVLEGGEESPTLSPDGDWLAFSRNNDVFLHNLLSGTESVIDTTSGRQRHPDFSPDSRYVAFETDESGRWDIAIRPITGTAYFPISHPQAQTPKWAPDGKSLYFLVPGDGIYRVSVTTEPSFDIRGEAQKVVSVDGDALNQWFDISPDGNTLAITGTSVGVDLQEEKTYSTLMWWRNWAQSLEDN